MEQFGFKEETLKINTYINQIKNKTYEQKINRNRKKKKREVVLLSRANTNLLRNNDNNNNNIHQGICFILVEHIANAQQRVQRMFEKCCI